MKFNKILILFIFIVFLAGVSFVSAENIGDTSDLSTVDTDDTISVDDVSDLSAGDADDSISTNEPEDNVGIDESDVLANSRSSITVTDWNGLGSAVNNNNYDTINLGANITPGSQISIGHSVTIVGSADTYIGGSSPSTSVSYTDIPIVTGANGLSVTFKNIRFQNCGGNTFMKLAGNGNFVLDNCTFENIAATGTKTVVVHLNYGTCDIINCTFDNCRSDYGTVSNYKTDQEPEKVNMVVRDTIFKNNYATTEPGGINNCGFLTVYNSTFVNNSAAWWAGAIHTHYGGNTTIYDSNFISNIAGWNGGALYTYNYVKVVNSNFTNNEAHNSDGGAIAASRYPLGGFPTVIIENCKFNNNSAVRYGGAISSANGILNVTDSDFIDNYAPTNGGAIYSNKCTANVINCFFRNNTAPNGKGGAIFGTGKGRLNVDYCIFVNNSALDDNSGHALAYSYTGSSATAAYLTYTNNEFYGPNNGTGSVYAANNKLNIVQYNNTISDYSNYTEPDDNSSGSVVPIPSGTPIGHQEWNASLSGALGGTPLVIGDRIYVPNGHSIYCLNVTNGALLWNVSSNYVDEPEWNNFHDLALHNGVLIAPSDMDKLYFFDAITGSQIQPNSTIIQGSSLYAPLVVGDKIYISSEYPYGVGGNKWIAVVEYANGTYNYTNSILEINNASTALISAPILWNNYLWVNTINGLVRYNLATNTYTIPITNTVGKPVVGGDYIYVLTADNHICGVNANGNVKNITVSNSVAVGSTLAINNVNNILYTIDAEGNIYRVELNSNSATPIRQINTVSSALTVGTDGYLYIGDDAGILWVINNYFDEDVEEWKINLIWAYNVSSEIYGVPIIVDDVVYIGTNDTFYGLTNPTRNLAPLKTNNILMSSINNQFTSSSELLSNTPDEILSEMDEVYYNPVDKPNFVHADFRNDAKQGNTIYYLNEGTYTVGTINIGGKTTSSGSKTPYNNIIIRPNGTANVIIDINPTGKTAGIKFTIGENITFENIKIISSKAHSDTYEYFIKIDGGNNIYIKNCTFENMSNNINNPNYGRFIYIAPNGDNIGNIYFENCRFINCNASFLIQSVEYTGGKKTSSIHLSNCTFENSFGVKDTFSFENTNEVYLENNTFDSSSIGNIIIESSSSIYSDVFFNVLTESLILGEEGSIVAELVDDKGNPIYLADVVRQGLDYLYTNYLNFKINGEEKTPTFDRTTGLYTLKYTPTSLDDIIVKASCSNIEQLNDDNNPILVKAITDLSVNCSDSAVYGNEFKVNATLDSTISGENITFTVLNSTSDPVKSANATITNGFASYSFADLPAGDYTVVANYTGGTSFAPVSKSKAFTITQADSSIEINVLNDIIHVGDKINVKAVVPTGATGNVTFRLENSKTVNVSEVATFDGLSAGNYTIFAIYNGDANYKASKEVNVTIDVVKYDFNLKISADNITYGEALVVKLSTNSNFTGGIYVYIGELKQAAQIICGVGNATFNNLTAADYFITANFTGDDSFYSDSANTTATVNGVEVPADKAISTNVPANTKSPTFSIKLDKDATGNFTVSIDNGKIVRTAELKDGAASITVADLAAGNHNISISYSGDGKYAPITQNTTLTINEPVKPTPKVTKKATKIVAKKKTFKAKVKVKKYTITLKSGKTLLKKVKVTLKVKGKTYTATTNKKGKATFKIKNLKKKGTYKAVIKFKGNKNYKATSKKVKIKVKK